MNEQESRSVLAIVLMAAHADGRKDDSERAAVRKVAESLGTGSGIDLASLHRDVLLAPPDLGQLAATLERRELRQFAYEMAVGICEADGTRGPDEVRFLERLQQALGLDAAAASAALSTADALSAATVEPPSSPPPVTGTLLGKANVPDAEIGRMITNASITNAALELLPESLSSMAIIPLQMRLVYRIGQAYGYPMDRTHAKDFLATLGVGLTSQYLEQFGRNDPCPCGSGKKYKKCHGMR